MQPMTQDGETRVPLATRLAASSDGLLEYIAREYGVSTFEVVRNLPTDQRGIAPGEAFADIMQNVTTWGEILLLIHNADIVLECTGTLPSGSFGHGYFNIHGDSPIGGHIRAENSSRLPSWRAAAAGAHPCRSSSTTQRVTRSSRSLSGATPIASWFPSRSPNSRRSARGMVETIHSVRRR